MASVTSLSGPKGEHVRCPVLWPLGADVQHSLVPLRWLFYVVPRVCGVAVWFLQGKGVSAPHCTAYTVLLSLAVWEFVFGMDQLLFKFMTGCEMHQDAMLGEKGLISKFICCWESTIPFWSFSCDVVHTRNIFLLRKQSVTQRAHTHRRSGHQLFIYKKLRQGFTRYSHDKCLEYSNRGQDKNSFPRA